MDKTHRKDVSVYATDIHPGNRLTLGVQQAIPPTDQQLDHQHLSQLVLSLYRTLVLADSLLRSRPQSLTFSCALYAFSSSVLSCAVEPLLSGWRCIHQSVPRGTPDACPSSGQSTCDSPLHLQPTSPKNKTRTI